MSDSTTKSRRIRWLIAVCVVAGAAVVAWWMLRRAPQGEQQPAPFPLPSFSESEHLNTGPNARYVGTSVCAECHRTNHQSYLLTAHSRALSDLDPSAEPPDGAFHHATSGRSYRVYRQGKEFRHEEVLRTAEGKEIARVDLPIRYLIGSGHFCRSYLVEVDGFLHESPITWYTSKKKWDMSPGYDFAQHWSFERPIRVGCLNCHAGRVEPDAHALQRMTLHEKAIGCENCHGPGALHADRHRSGKRARGEDDRTIVHPGKLSRSLLEAVCANCHLGSAASVLLRGRAAADFRPGMPLSDYRIDYRFDSGGEQMTVVGHVEQLRRSACYQKSKDMTCLTCHDPHRREAPKDLTAFYRNKCLSCHTPEACGLKPAERLKKEDNCTACHMPQGDTDIPHIAFTHHRIGRHSAKPPAAPKRASELVPIDDVARLSPIDRQRNLGLAYLEVVRNPAHAAHATGFDERARSLLEAVHSAGLRDAATLLALAEIYWKRDRTRAGAYARQALEAKDLSPEERAPAMMILADCHYEDGNYTAAIELLDKVVRMRRLAEDWRLLGASHLLNRDPHAALRALQTALSIRPTREFVHGGLFEAYRHLGDHQRAQEHLEKAQWLAKNRQD